MRHICPPIDLCKGERHGVVRQMITPFATSRARFAPGALHFSGKGGPGTDPTLVDAPVQASFAVPLHQDERGARSLDEKGFSPTTSSTGGIDPT
ncbi:MAG TPA: hypothetical protein VFN35_21240 [Ktedonobacteraceae bacterium]|nr:hypothetical protein [Ktedonobacteraceae bacterium]